MANSLEMRAQVRNVWKVLKMIWFNNREKTLKYLNNNNKDTTIINSILERTSKTALVILFRIWLGRARTVKVSVNGHFKGPLKLTCFTSTRHYSD